MTLGLPVLITTHTKGYYLAEKNIVTTLEAFKSYPQSNGVVECANRTVIKRVRVLLHESGLPASMWCEVASTVLYLKDFALTVRYLDTTPFKD
jgi:hypothetical protein